MNEPLARRPGRPRSPAVDDAILRAARQVLAEDGWAGFSVERVAAVAGVAKTTLYRRWSSRADLAVGAVAELLAAARVAPSGSGADDVRNATRAVSAALREPAARAAYLAVIAEAARDEALRTRVDEQLLAPTRQLVVEGLARAESRGEVPPGTDADLVHDLVAGAMVHRFLLRGEEIDDAFLDAVASIALALARLGADPPA